MITPTRTLHLLIIAFIVLLFYLSGPFSTSTSLEKHPSDADARLARWLEAVSPPGKPYSPPHAYDPPSYKPVDAKSKPLIPLDPYPLGKPSNTFEELPQATFHGKEFVEVKFGFQEDLSLPQPKVDLKKFKSYTPRNYVPGYRQETFATFLCTPNASIYDPYFSATLNLVYRNLWSPEIASKERPFTVFVAPFITQEQRDILAGAGAVIQELELLPWEPNIPGVWGRWRDQFTKLNMWGQTQYTAIAFMDSDAFPIKNVDSVFDEAQPRDCDVSKLTAEDEKVKDQICHYTFAGVENIGGDGSVNGGFLFIVPNLAMRHRLLRNYVKVDQYDNRAAEQSFFQWQFAQNGPFPVQLLPRKYNAFFPQDSDEGQVNIVHEKLWAWGDKLSPWLRGTWERGWQEMIEFYDSDAFRHAREKDNEVKMHHNAARSQHAGINENVRAKILNTETGIAQEIHQNSPDGLDVLKGPRSNEIPEKLMSSPGRKIYQQDPPPMTERQRKLLERRNRMKTPYFASSP